jgi:hypothetical protein
VTAEQIALLLAGIVAPFLINVIKNWLGWSGKPALWLSLACSVVIAVVAMLIAGQFQPSDWSNPLLAADAILKACAIIFALATLIYKQFMAKL